MTVTRIGALIILMSGFSPAGAGSSVAPQSGKPWQLRVVTTSRNCLVQTSTSSPIGEFLSDYDTRKEACAAARDQYDSSMSDQSKCWVYGTGTRSGCKAEGIDLP